MAQVRAVLVKNLDEPGRNPYTGAANCISVQGGGCQLTFPAVPVKMRLVVEHVDVFLQANSAIAIAKMSGGSGLYYPAFQTLPVTPDADYVNTVITQTTLAYFEAGPAPLITVFSVSGYPVTGSVQVTGYLVNLSD